MSRLIIAVDGLAGSGKTTISRRLAERLGFLHFSSGLIYRGVALLVLKTHTDVDNPEAIVAMLRSHTIELCTLGSDRSAALFVDGHNETGAVHTPEISEATSKSAQHGKVREYLLATQRGAFPGVNLVAEGRDMGTVVFPDALVKFFVEADPAVRIQRRMQQLSLGVLNEDQQAELKQKMAKEITERDHRDAGRLISPAKAASDAVRIDNSSRSLDQIIDEMHAIVRSKGVGS